MEFHILAIIYLSLNFNLFCNSASCLINNNVLLGDFVEGGIVFWLNDEQNHGLVCSLEDIQYSIKLPWSLRNGVAALNNLCEEFFSITPSGLIFTEGRSFTANIIKMHDFENPKNDSYAAAACSAYCGGGYNDWYLPSFRELCLIHSKLSLLNKKFVEYGGSPLLPWYYWSSSEFDESTAWTVYMSYLVSHLIFFRKNEKNLVRAIRAF